MLKMHCQRLKILPMWRNLAKSGHAEWRLSKTAVKGIPSWRKTNPWKHSTMKIGFQYYPNPRQRRRRRGSFLIRPSSKIITLKTKKKLLL